MQHNITLHYINSDMRTYILTCIHACIHTLYIQTIILLLLSTSVNDFSLVGSTKAYFYGKIWEICPSPAANFFRALIDSKHVIFFCFLLVILICLNIFLTQGRPQDLAVSPGRKVKAKGQTSQLPYQLSNLSMTVMQLASCEVWWRVQPFKYATFGYIACNVMFHMPHQESKETNHSASETWWFAINYKNIF